MRRSWLLRGREQRGSKMGRYQKYLVPVRGILCRTAMNFSTRYKGKQRIAWMQVIFALLLMLPGLAVGQWRCEDGRICRTCTQVSPETPEVCKGDLDCLAAALTVLNCRTCCHYVSRDAPIVDSTHRAIIADVPIRLSSASYWVPPVPPKLRESRFPDADASPPRSPLIRLRPARAPPTVC